MQGNIKRSLLGPGTVRRIIVYGIAVLILGCAQCAFFPMLNICPATPDLIIGMLLAIALLDCPTSTGVTAVCAGFFLDALGGSGIAISPLIYFLYVLMISMFSSKVLKSFFSYVLLLIPTLIYRAAATYLCFSLRIAAWAPVEYITQVIIPEAITTAVLCLPIYFIIKLFSRSFENHSRFTF